MATTSLERLQATGNIPTIAQSIGMAVVDELLLEPTVLDRERLWSWLAGRLGTKAANDIDDYVGSLALEAAQVGLRLGYALAVARLLGPSLGSNGQEDSEEMRRLAVRWADLEGYEPRVRMEGEERW